MAHQFHNPRPTKANSFQTQTTGYDKGSFQPLPDPRGKAPFRLDIQDILPDTKLSTTKMVFHTVGDTGGIKEALPQQLVADKMEEQFTAKVSTEDNPLFFYHLGDVAYYYGEESNYYSQFFDPYIHYPAPILAIPGNHDGDIDPTNPKPPASLAAFMEVFCDKKPRKLDISGDAGRTSTIQPNVYWTLQTPLANIIGLYTNVPEHGVVKADQKKWFLEELTHAQTERKDKALIVALHHPVFSVDNNHGSSGAMKDLLDEAFESTGVYPDLILTAHVHNYQRFSRKINGKLLTYLVNGAGGYFNLHHVGSKKDPVAVPNDSLIEGVTLENFNDDHHGFLRITIEKNKSERTLKGEYFIAPSPTEPSKNPAKLFDQFVISL